MRKFEKIFYLFVCLYFIQLDLLINVGQYDRVSLLTNLAKIALNVNYLILYLFKCL